MQLKLGNLKRSSDDKTNYPVEKKIEAVTHYMLLGNMRQVSVLTGIAYSTLRLWKTNAWWKDLEAEIKAARRMQVNTKLSKIVDKALEAVEDRLDNGDIRFNPKTNELERVPVSALTATKITTDLMQRQEALEKVSLAEVEHQQTQTIADQLQFLATQFAAFNKGRTVDLPPVEEVKDAVEPTMVEQSGESGEDAVGEEEVAGEESELREGETDEES